MKIGARILRGIYGSLLAIDMLAAAMTGGAPGETISARLARNKGLDRLACRLLDSVVLRLFGQEHHCELALIAFNARVAAAPFTG